MKRPNNKRASGLYAGLRWLRNTLFHEKEATACTDEHLQLAETLALLFTPARSDYGTSRPDLYILLSFLSSKNRPKHNVVLKDYIASQGYTAAEAQPLLIGQYWRYPDNHPEMEIYITPLGDVTEVLGGMRATFEVMGDAYTGKDFLIKDREIEKRDPPKLYTKPLGQKDSRDKPKADYGGKSCALPCGCMIWNVSLDDA